MQHIREAKTDHDYLAALGIDFHQRAASILDEMFATDFEQTAGWYAVIEGAERMLFDDLHPSMGTFSMDKSFVAIVPGSYMTVAMMIEKAQGLFKRADDSAPTAMDAEGFFPHLIRILDHDGNTVLVYNYTGWWEGPAWEAARNAPFVPE